MSGEGALAGRAVIVTGAGRGLGRAYALEAAAQGASVLVNDVAAEAATETTSLIVAAGGTAAAHAGSVAEWKTAGTLVGACIERFGAVDGLVNNAGVLVSGPAWEASEEELRRIVAVNVLGAMFCGTQAMRAMVARSRGAIVNVVSGAALGLPQLSAYGATKGAALSLTYGWALDLEGTGVRVNAISPLAFTPMGDAWAAGDQDSSLPPERIAPAVAYLLSDRSSRLNGKALRFDGRALSVLAPPHLAARSEEREGWTLADVAAAAEALA